MKKIKKANKKFVVILLILSILAISCATVSAAAVDDVIIDDQSDSIDVDDVAVDDSIDDDPQLDEISVKAVGDDTGTGEVLGATYDGVTDSDFARDNPMYEIDMDYSENHHFELKDDKGNLYVWEKYTGGYETTDIICTTLNKYIIEPTKQIVNGWTIVQDKF